MILFLLPAMEQAIAGEDFNEYVIQIMKTYPTNGTHQYYWPQEGSWAGNTRDLYYRGELFSAGDPMGRCYCCGLTFEVFFRAYELYCEDKGKPFVIKDFSRDDLLRFRKQWFGADGNPQTLYHAIISNGLGHAVTLEEACPGDFVQFWRHSGSGHSVIFVSWVRDPSMNIIGLQYWSTQKSTNGIGYNTEFMGDDSGMDISRVYIARVNVK